MIMKNDKAISKETDYVPKKHKSYSIDEILASGGTTAFAKKIGKKPENIARKLRELPADAFFSFEEMRDALATLNASK